jgi:formate/nitrite transporter FocA (FNT family)
MADGADVEAGAPEPEQIYERTRLEGVRRLERPLHELVSTALAAGFDIVVGLVAFALVTSALTPHFGPEAAHVGGSVAFGLAFVFLVVGRGELFTENFLVPLAGLDGKERHAWRKLAELWTVSPVFNILSGTIVATIVTVHGVLPEGSGTAIEDAAYRLHANHPLALFTSAVFAGALMTAMTWFVEGQDSMGVLVAIALAVGAIIALGTFNHVIVESVELIMAIRFGAHIHWSFWFGNLGLAAAGNMVGGIGLVTLNRFTQARSSRT